MTTCPACATARQPDAVFCEECGYDFTGAAPLAPARASAESQTRVLPGLSAGTAAGEESPLDVGWTGPITRGPAAAPDDGPQLCPACGIGSYEDGYCNNCGAKRPDPRDHFTEAPAPWVGGVCDIGRRHARNEDAMALAASQGPLQSAALVVCDGVSNSTDSHVASLAAARAARDLLDDPLPHGMGLPEAVLGSIEARLAEAVLRARDAVVRTTSDVTVADPPSCTFVAAVIDEGTAVVGNVGDSRAYWLPDATASAARQLTVDDSFAAEQIREGAARKQAETGPQAHAITRWLGVDSPGDLTPHTEHLRLDEDGWLLVCSDGLWNYCSDAAALGELVRSTVAQLEGGDPVALAQALVDFANTQGGRDNITVALARVGATAPVAPSADLRAETIDADASAARQAASEDGVTDQPPDHPTPTGEDSADGTVHH